ncbi:hypothetical protein GDO78_013637 [Eleutherodactylus coqui]|uniref:WD repeat-containing protein 76 n=2 Tax=Eleutherodactylus coqui TaxID=57060 RepID=A0A8J6E4J8_ELECQ|nr:hypothetical protein GDO78_013637 [Eleutherodactylus coqui]
MSKRRSVRLLERKVLIKIPEKDDSDDSVVLGPKQLQIHGPIKMAPSNYVDHGAWISFQETWKSISTVKCVKPSSFKCKKITSYANKLQKLTLKEKAVKRTILGSVSSIAIHPSETRTLVAAGDCNGNIGLWDLKRRSADIYVFPVHSRRTRIVAFSPSDPQYLLSLGYEGTIRCGDISYSVFDEIYHAEGYLTSFDFLSVDGSVLLASHYDSKLSVVDRRTRNKTSNVHGCLDSKFVYSVSVHPLQRDLCVVAGSSDVLVYDVRQLRKDTTQPVMSLLRHTSGVASASFSPATGNCILTSSMEPCLQ